MVLRANNGVKYERYTMLDGSSKLLVKQVRDGSIVKRFDRTPLPQKPTDVVCPHFLELKWAYGCPFNCAWCYLNGTFRFLPTKKRPVFKDRKKIVSHLNLFFNAERKNKEILNTGELCDSLMYENNGNPFSKFIIPFFENQKKHKILFLSKSDHVDNILYLEPNGQTITSFTINANDVSRKWEKLAPTMKKRIKAVKKLSEIGCEVRVRIDPMVPIKNWKKHYTDLIDNIFSNFTPERITIGSLRGLQSTINNCEDKSWTVHLSESSGWGKKIDFKIRFEMYMTVIHYLKEMHNFSEISFCKETIEMWNALKMNYKKIKCNCIW